MLFNKWEKWLLLNNVECSFDSSGFKSTIFYGIQKKEGFSKPPSHTKKPVL